jgi:hypothetical protein
MKEVSIKIFLKLFAGRIGTGCMFLDPALVFSSNNSCVQRCPYSLEGHRGIFQVKRRVPRCPDFFPQLF